ncbi:MAG: hypothetical protein O2877_00955, partial [bacterium]|nr:hypothetical protein [bacterium]
ALVMFTADGVSGSWRWASATAVMFETVEAEMNGDNGERRYAYITDRELFLNIGRVAAIAILVLFLSFAPSQTIRYGLLVTILFQIPLILLTRRQTK